MIDVRLRQLAAAAAEEIERGLSPDYSPNLKKLVDEKTGGEPMYDSINHYSHGHGELKDSALASCRILADVG
jgi:hypothetical protein